MFRPNEAAQMTTPMILQTPTVTKYNGVPTKTFTDASGLIYASFKTYGGTEKQVDGIIAVEDTATVVCWYRPDVGSGCRVKRLADNAVFEIIGEPENIEMRNMILRFKVRRVKGGA